MLARLVTPSGGHYKVHGRDLFNAISYTSSDVDRGAARCNVVSFRDGRAGGLPFVMLVTAAGPAHVSFGLTPDDADLLAAWLREGAAMAREVAAACA